MIFSIATIGPSIIKFFINNWKPMVFISLLVGNIIQWEYYWPAKVNYWETKFNDTNAALLVCNESRKELKTNIDMANQQISEWATVTKDRQSSIDSLVKELSSMKKQNTLEVEQMLKEKPPETCELAINMLKKAATSDLLWTN